MKKFTVLMLVMSLLYCNNLMAQEAAVTVQITLGVKNQELKAIMESNASILLSAFNKAVKENKKPKYPKEIIEEEVGRKIEALWKSSQMLCTANDVRGVCRTTSSGEYQIRRIPMQLLAADSAHKDEEISLSFNNIGKISDIGISIQISPEMLAVVGEVDEEEAGAASEVAEETLNGDKTIQSDDFTGTATPEYSAEDVVNYNKILDFIEKLRTAYNCKDLEYLENVYSDNALIINAVKKTMTTRPGNMEQNIILTDYGYDYQVKTKRQYLDKLTQVFKKNRFVNITFDSIRITPHPGFSKVYSVDLYQKWNASDYSDKGFLFLLIDCRKEYEMQIFVRAWAPEQIFNFNSFNQIKLREIIN